MKRMGLISLSILPLVFSLTSMRNNAQREKQKIDYLNNNKEKSEYQKNELWYQSKSQLEITQLKNNLVNSISLVNYKVLVNKKMLLKKLWLEKFDFLTSKEYANRLNFLYKFKLMKFDYKKLIFNDGIFYSQENGIWFESSWWWFRYWRMHIENDITQKIAWAINNSGDIMSIFGEAMGDNPLAFSTQFVSSIVSLTGFVWNKIPRLTIHFYLIAVLFFQPW